MRVVIDIRTTHRAGIYRYACSLMNALEKNGFFQKNDVYVAYLYAEWYEDFAWFHNPDLKKVLLDDDHMYIRRSDKLLNLCSDVQVDIYFSINYTLDLRLPTKKVIIIHDLIGLEYPELYYSDQAFCKKYGRAEYNLLKEVLDENEVEYSLDHDVVKEYYLHYNKKLINHVDKVLTVSNTSSNKIEELLKPHQSSVKVIYAAVDKTVFNRNGEKYNDNAKYILYVGQARKHKRFDFLLKAIKEISRPVKVIVVGNRDAFEKEYSDYVCLMQESTKLEFTGYLSDQELAVLYRGACAFVTTSQIEGFCLPVLEALNCGTPVICPDINVFKELYEGQANFFEKDSVEELAGLIENAIDEKLIKCSEDFCGKFEWEDIAKTVEKVLDSVCRDGKSIN